MKRLFVMLCSILLLSSPIKSDSSDLKEVPASLTIYVPVKHAKLERRKVKGKLYNFMPTASDTYTSVVAEEALSLLFRKSPTSFPKGTKLTKFPEIKDGIMRVSLGKEFLMRGFWNSKQRTMLAVYAIVSTAAESYVSNEPLRVRFLIEDKPFRNLANMDMRKPLIPRMDIITKPKAG